MSTPILVTGATGQLGSEIVRLLAETGAPAALMTRSPQKAEAVAPPGAQIVFGDMAVPDSLPVALEGVQTLLLCSVPDPSQVELQSNVIQAARQQSVRYIIKVSAIGADANSPVSLLRWHGQTEQELASSGIAWTNLQPSFFMQNMLGMAAGIASKGMFYGCSGTGKMGLVDVRDIAAVAAVCLTTSGHQGRNYVVTGPEALSYFDVAQKLTAASGRVVSYVDVAPESLIFAMTAAGMPQWLAEAFAGLQKETAAGRLGAVTDVVQSVAGKRPVAFDEFAREHADRFKAQTTAA
jgi:uncharacterized protein YbjT (DUF2867 family)